ncbi:MAG: hypothetical protein NVSMB9_24600 [Isosphaeraceae bacterium]
MQLVENALREDLKPVEQARAYRTLMDRNGWTGARLAEALHLNAASVSRALALLDLPCTVQESVERGDLPASVAYEVSKLDDPADQAEVGTRAVSEGLSRAEGARTVKARASGRGKVAAKGGGGKAAKVCDRTFKTGAGKVTVENKKGLTPDLILAALAAAMDRVRSERAEAVA